MTLPIAVLEGQAAAASARPAPRADGFTVLLGRHLAAATGSPESERAELSPDAPASGDAAQTEPRAAHPVETAPQHQARRSGEPRESGRHAAHATGVTESSMAGPLQLATLPITVADVASSAPAKPMPSETKGDGDQGPARASGKAIDGAATTTSDHAAIATGETPVVASVDAFTAPAEDDEVPSADTSEVDETATPAATSAKTPRQHDAGDPHAAARLPELGHVTPANTTAPFSDAQQAPAPSPSAVSPGQAGAADAGGVRSGDGVAAATPGAGTPASAPDASSVSAPPAAQLGHALAALHSGKDGASHLTVQLDPVELGQVSVRISRAHDGTTSVSVSVERPETLHSLEADLGHLHDMLDRAGLPDHRSVSLHLAAPDTSASGSAGLSAGAGQSGAQGGFQQRNDTGQGRASGSHASSPTSGSEAGPNQAATGSDPPAATRWFRAGVNITA